MLLLIQTLPAFWAERILIVIIYFFGILLVSRFPDVQVLRFPDLQTPPLEPEPDELKDPNSNPLPTHPGIKYIVGCLCCDVIKSSFLKNRKIARHWSLSVSVIQIWNWHKLLSSEARTKLRENKKLEKLHPEQKV